MYPSMLLCWWCHRINRHIGGNHLRPRSFLSYYIEVRANKLAHSSQLCTSTTLPTGSTTGPHIWHEGSTWHKKKKGGVDGTHQRVPYLLWGPLCVWREEVLLVGRQKKSGNVYLQVTLILHTTTYQSNLTVKCAPGTINWFSEGYWLWGGFKIAGRNITYDGTWRLG